MATELGQAYVQIMPSARGISGAIRNQVMPEAESAGQSAGVGMGSKMVSALKGIIVAAGIGKSFSMAITEGADLEQSLGGIETLFKGSADKVKKYADEAYKTSGLSANDYMENVTGFSASLLQSLGGNTEKAADTANMAMIDMSDNANKMGTSMGDIQNAYQGFAKQNYTMLDNLKLGYGGTKEEMQRLLTDAQKLTGVKYDINNLSDVYNAIHAVQGELGITGTTAKEAAETLSGSLSAMKSAFSNVLGNLALGRDIEPSLNALAETTSTFLFKNFLPMVGNILKALPGALVTFVKASIPLVKDAFMGMIDSLSNSFGGAFKGVTDIFSKFGESSKGLADSFKNLTPNIDLPTVALNILKVAVMAISGPIGLVIKAMDALSNVFKSSGVTEGVSQMSNSISDLASGIAQNAPLIGTSFGQALQGILTAIANSLPGIIQGAVSIITSFVTGIAQGLPQIALAAAQLITSFTGSMLMLMPTIVLSATQLIVGFVGALTVSLPQIIVAGSGLINALLQGIIQQLPLLIENTATLIVTWLTALNAHLPEILQAGFNLLITFLTGIANNIGQVSQQALNIIFNFSQVIIQNMPTIVNTAVDLMISFVGGLTARLPDIITTAAQLIASFVNGIANNLGLIIDSAVNLIVKFLEGIASKIPDIVNAAMDLVDAMVNGILQAQGRLMDAAINLVRGMANNISSRQEDIRSAAWELLQAMIGVFVPDSLWNAGQAIMQGFLNGLESMWGAVTDFVGGIANWIAENKGPISYDRKLLIPAGKAIMGGLNDSLQDSFSDVQKTVKGVGPGIQDNMGGISDSFSLSFSSFDFDKNSIKTTAESMIDYLQESINSNLSNIELNDPLNLSRQLLKESYDGSNQKINYNQIPQTNHIDYRGMFDGATINWTGRDDIRKTMQEIAYVTKIEGADMNA